MKNFKDEAVSIAKWVNGTNKLDHFYNVKPCERIFLHLPRLFLTEIFKQKEMVHKPSPSKTSQKSDGRAVKLWENQDYPLWELKAIAKEGTIQSYKITYVRPVGKIEEQSKNIPECLEKKTAHQYVLLPEKLKEPEQIPEPFHPNRSTDSRMRVSKL